MKYLILTMILLTSSCSYSKKLDNHELIVPPYIQSDYPEEGKFDPSDTLNSQAFDAYEEEKPHIKKTKTSKVDKNNKIELKPKKYKCLSLMMESFGSIPNQRNQWYVKNLICLKICVLF